MTALKMAIGSSVITRAPARLIAKRAPVNPDVNRVNAKMVGELINLRVNPACKPLVEQDYKNEGPRYGVEPAALHAFADVESNASGQTVDGRLPILYEPHINSRCSFGKYDWRDGPYGMGVVISYPKWYSRKKMPPRCTIHPYQLSMLDRWVLLSFAAEIDFSVALQSCSWGAFQVLGMNWKALGYASPWHFVVSMYDGGERAQLNAAIRFLDHKDVLDDMKKNNWGPVIEAWNGTGNVDEYLPRFLSRLKVRREQYGNRH
jgi:hypothetical protein